MSRKIRPYNHFSLDSYLGACFIFVPASKKQKELLIPDEVDQWTGYRYYSIRQMLKLNSIRHLQQLGFTLEEIRDLYDEESHTPSVEQLTEKIVETEKQIPIE